MFLRQQGQIWSTWRTVIDCSTRTYGPGVVDGVIGQRPETKGGRLDRIGDRLMTATTANCPGRSVAGAIGCSRVMVLGGQVTDLMPREAVDSYLVRGPLP